MPATQVLKRVHPKLAFTAAGAQVVAALVTNDGSYADEIVLIFERPVG